MRVRLIGRLKSSMNKEVEENDAKALEARKRRFLQAFRDGVHDAHLIERFGYDMRYLTNDDDRSIRAQNQGLPGRDYVIRKFNEIVPSRLRPTFALTPTFAMKEFKPNTNGLLWNPEDKP